MPEYGPLPKAAAAATKAAAGPAINKWIEPLQDAAQAFADAYAEHLNHHCAKCTQAWDKLKAALEAVPPR